MEAIELHGTIGAGFADRRAGSTASSASIVGRLFALLAEWQERIERRRSYERIDAHLMQDIGLTPVDMIAAASRRA